MTIIICNENEPERGAIESIWSNSLSDFYLIYESESNVEVHL